jgi:Glyoxalase-like domain
VPPDIRSCRDRHGILLVLGAAATSGRDRKVAYVANFVSGVTIDCVDPQRVARFWSALLGREPGPSQAGWVYLGHRGDPQPRLVFQPVPEPKAGKVRIHLDVTVDDALLSGDGRRKLRQSAAGCAAGTTSAQGYEHRVVGENREPVVHPFGIGEILPVRKEPSGIGERQPAFDLVDLGRERDGLRGACVDGS